MEAVTNDAQQERLMKKGSACAISSQRLILFALRYQDKCVSSEAVKGVICRKQMRVLPGNEAKVLRPSM